MNKKRTTTKQSAREISTILSRRSKYYTLAIAMSVLLLVLALVVTINRTDTGELASSSGILISTLTLFATIIFLIIVPSFGQHVFMSSSSKQSRIKAAQEPVKFVLARWTSVVLVLTLILNSRDLWNNVNSLAVNYVGFMDVVGIALVAVLFAVVMAGRQFDVKWKLPLGLAFTVAAIVVSAVQLFVIVHISLI